MIIENISELQKILGNLDIISPEHDKKFIVLHAGISEWQDRLSSALTDAGDGLMHVALQIQHHDERLDTILFVCHSHEINDWFYEILTNYCYNKPADELLLKALDKKWEINPRSYPLLFLLSTRPEVDYTTLCYLTTAPAYRQQGFMKRISLNLIKNIMREYGEEHVINAFTTHQASYRLFNPTDKEFRDFCAGDLQDLSCKHLLSEHGISSEEPVLKDDAKAGWMGNALLKPPAHNQEGEIQQPNVVDSLRDCKLC